MIATPPETHGKQAVDRMASPERAAELLSLLAAPTLAVMALVASLSGGSATGMLCSPTPGSSHFSEMVQMYLLMSLFHTGAWLKLLSRGTTN